MELDSLNWSHIEPTKKKVTSAFDSDFEGITEPESLFSHLPKDQLEGSKAVGIRLLLWGLGCVNRLNFEGKSTASVSKRRVFLDKLSAVVEQKWPAVSATRAQVNTKKSKGFLGIRFNN